MRILFLACLGALLAVALPAGSAVAQSDTVVLSGSELGVMTPSQVQERVAQLEKDYNSVNLARLRAGVGVSSVLVPGGAFMLALGIGVTNFEATSGGPGGAGPALIVSGALALAGGLVGIFNGVAQAQAEEEEATSDRAEDRRPQTRTAARVSLVLRPGA
ncbi:MAG: hypothetical protein WBM48_18400 [Polyangiales bacterium]